MDSASPEFEPPDTEPARGTLLQRAARRLLSAGRIPGVTPPEPVVIDGRVLDRSIQTLLAVGAKTGMDSRPEDPQEMRDGLKALSSMGMPAEPGVHVDEIRIPGHAGLLRARVYRAFGRFGPQPAVLYFHGGGWVTGDLDTHDGTCRRLAIDSACTVIAVDYRLAPEHPFPAAPLDCLAAYLWVVEQGETISVDTSRVGVAGDSAGGNLAAVVAQEAPRRGRPAPFAQCLVYPVTDQGRSYPSLESVGSGFGLDTATMDWFWNHYMSGAPQGDEPTDGAEHPVEPMAAPMRYADLSNVTPAIVATAGFDPLRDEGSAYAEALRAAGTEVEYRCYGSFIHGFFGMGLLPNTMAAIIEIGRAIGTKMHR